MKPLLRQEIVMGPILWLYTVAEILVRLPSKSVLRCRAVSRAWRRITTDPAFLAAHARRRPLEVLLRTIETVSPWEYPYGHISDVVVDTLQISADQAGRRPLIRHPYTIRGTSCKSPDGLHYSLVTSSCDGVLLFKISGTGTYHICNPVTRQWTELPQLPKINQSFVLEYGFYYHQPSGDFRLLIRCYIRATMMYVYYVLSTGATEPRVLSMEDVDESTTAVIMGIHYSCKYFPVGLHGRLHRLSFKSNMIQLVAFDTTSETFHLITPPPSDIPVKTTVFEKSNRTILFAMDGLLAVAEFGDMRTGLWFLEDYGGISERWECRHWLINPPMLEQQLRAAEGTTRWNTIMCIAIEGTDDEGGIIVGTIQGEQFYGPK